MDAYPRWSETSYLERVAPRPSPETSWQRYLRDAQNRPGWSVARIARESKGAVSKATIFRMMSGETQKVATQTVLAIARVLGDDEEVALKAAGDLLDDEGDVTGGGGGDPDWYITMVEDSKLPKAAKDALIARRRDDLERERKRLEEDLRLMESSPPAE